MKEIAAKAMEQKRKEDSEVVQEEVSCAGESRKKGEEDQEKLEQLVSTSQKGKKKTMNSLDLKEVRRSMK